MRRAPARIREPKLATLKLVNLAGMNRSPAAVATYFFFFFDLVLTGPLAAE